MSSDERSVFARTLNDSALAQYTEGAYKRSQSAALPEQRAAAWDAYNDYADEQVRRSVARK